MLWILLHGCVFHVSAARQAFTFEALSPLDGFLRPGDPMGKMVAWKSYVLSVLLPSSVSEDARVYGVEQWDAFWQLAKHALAVSRKSFGTWGPVHTGRTGAYSERKFLRPSRYVSSLSPGPDGHAVLDRGLRC